MDARIKGPGSGTARRVRLCPAAAFLALTAAGGPGLPHAEEAIIDFNGRAAGVRPAGAPDSGRAAGGGRHTPRPALPRK